MTALFITALPPGDSECLQACVIKGSVYDEQHTHMLADPASVECGEYDRMTERRVNELKKVAE